MKPTTRRLLDDILVLSEEEQLEIATQILIRVEGPAGSANDSDWDESWADAWLFECQQRTNRAANTAQPGTPWQEVRNRILKRIQS